jgi:hypothetical protein
MLHWYNNALCICGEYRDGASSVALPAKKAKDFVDSTKTWLDAIKSTKTGGQLLEAIKASGHKVKIYRTKGLDDGNYQGGGDDALAMVVPFGKVHDDGTTELHRVLERACEDLSGRTKVQKFFGIGRAKPRYMDRDAVARLAGISSSDLKAAEAGKKALPKKADERLKVHLYDFLTPGGGDDCYVVFNHKKTNLNPAHQRFLPESHDWKNRPPGIALAHELIHAWRVVVGRVLFAYGWEEEAMTVGLPPFSSMPFTENRVRIDWGNLSVRPDYAYIGFQSDLMKGTQNLGIDGEKKWQGKKSALHSQQFLQQQLASRRKAMGYDDDDDDGGSDDDDDF